jgi:hypothetical protein
MTVDERIERLVDGLTRLEAAQQKTEVMLAGVIDGLARLERIAGVLLLNDEDLDRRLTELEGKSRKRPQ